MDNVIVNESPRTALISWAQGQDKWVQQLVYFVSTSRCPPTEQELQLVYSTLLQEKELAEGKEGFGATEFSLNAGEGESIPFTLSDLVHIGGVNRLIPNQRLEFNSRFTVIYGENGVGKTGYVRILKKLAGVRNAEDVLADVSGDQAASGARATIRYRFSAEEHSVSWSHESNVSPFNRMAIFDARCAALHVDSELSFHYTPKELSLFKFVHDGLEPIRRLLENESKERAQRENNLLPRFSRGTRIYLAIETLGASTDLSQLESWARTADSEKVDSLSRQISALESGNITSELQIAKESQEHWENLATLCSRLKGADVAGSQALYATILQLRSDTRKLTEEMFSNHDVPGANSKSWDSFIRAAHSYTKENLAPSYPVEGANCIFCRQALNASAVELITHYRLHVEGELRQRLTRAEEELRRKLQIVDAEQSLLLSAWFKRRLETSSQTQLNELLSEVVAFLTELQALSEEDVEQLLEALPKIVQQANDLLAQVREKATETKTAKDLLSGTADDQKKNLAPLKVQLAEARDAVELNKLMHDVSSRVRNAKWIDRASKVLGSFRAISRSLTELSKTASEEVVRRDFEKHFAEESEALRCPSVILSFPGRKGETARRKTVCESHSLGEVLSDGEQKVIALADFLAEVSVSEHDTPLIFDDPITSLDYKRMEHVVTRLYQISRHRQVIVFTHNIWFTVEILQRFQDNSKECSFIELREQDDGKGFVSQHTSPRIDKWEELQKDLKKLITEVKKHDPGTVYDALVRQGYSILRSLCELAVEEKLFKGVVRRFAPNIALMKLAKIKPDGISAVQEHVSPLFERCCRKLEGHSQALETLNVRATANELEKDWQQLEAAVANL